MIRCLTHGLSHRDRTLVVLSSFSGIFDARLPSLYKDRVTRTWQAVDFDAVPI